jgi:FlaA1/EpsC-like NDP-sugar epimerase/lipopolysaccharide/colanic/teichoic acid biosynthesis glycosyltransferase
MANILTKSKQDLVVKLDTPPLVRGLDLLGSGLGLILWAPVFLAIGLLVKFTSAGPIFYKAGRIGHGGHPFKLYKFRSMVRDADRQGPKITVKNDPRVTPVGRFLRRVKLDELPQLINVLRGEMSLVGPTPEDPRYVALYTPEQQQVLSVRPGIISPASLHYRAEESMLAGGNRETIYKEQILPRKLALELGYLQKRTVWTDIELILQTIFGLIDGGRYATSILTPRNRHFFILDLIALIFIPALALSLRLEGVHWWPEMARGLIFFTMVTLLVKLPIFYILGLYKRYWRYTGVGDLVPIVVAVGASTTLLLSFLMGLHHILDGYGLAMYRTVPLIGGLLTLLAVGGSRIGWRGLYHWQSRRSNLTGNRRVLVVGAGEGGTMVVREMWANPLLNMEPIAFVDDDPVKIGTHIHNLPVLGKSCDIPKLVAEYQIHQIIVAMPSVPLPRQQEIMAICQQAEVITHELPGVYEILAGYKTVSPVPKIDIQYLLNRPPIVTDQTEVIASLKNVTVLVTGAGGSIGSQLCRQIARAEPSELVLLGRGENSIFEIGLELRLSFPELVTHQVIVDVRDQKQIDRVVEKYRPRAIFHAAAHKHVPYMEEHVEEAITNNVQGTQSVLRAAEQYGVERFVLISTDKAVNFGNVLGSRGSVIPLFQRQIAAGGPLTVTDPNMRRYFITIPEAVQLVLQASVLGQGGEVFVLDMGESVHIIDLATNLVKLSGLELGRDIEVVYSGIRPGEKLNEELFLASEDYRLTKHPKIFVATHESTIETEGLEQIIADIIELSKHIRNNAMSEQLRIMVPKICFYIDEYRPQPSSPVPQSVAAPSPRPSSLHTHISPLLTQVYNQQ